MLILSPNMFFTCILHNVVTQKDDQELDDMDQYVLYDGAMILTANPVL